MPVDVAPVAGPSDLDQFLKLPWRIYRGDSHWVPPILEHHRQLLDRSHHPFHQHAEVELFLARRQGTPVGRIAVSVNHQYIRFHGEPAGFFGFFECVDAAAVAGVLLSTAERWLAERGMQIMRGPMSWSTNEECGLLIDGWESPPALMMPYNPRYYPALMDRCGLSKAKDLYSYYADRGLVDPARREKARRLVERIKKRADLTLRPPDMRRFGDELALIKTVYQRAWSQNWGFVPMTDAEFDYLAAQLKQLIVPQFARIVTLAGEPAAFALLLPNYNEAIKHINGRLWPFGVPLILASYYLRRIKGLRLALLGVVAEHQKKGLDVVMIDDLYEEAARSHYQWCDLGLVLEDNHLMNNSIRSLGATLYKRYRIYERAISRDG
jgi:hypothetical protein